MSKTYAQKVIVQSVSLKRERNCKVYHGDYYDVGQPDEGEHESVHGRGYHSDYYDVADWYAIPKKTLAQKIVHIVRSVFQNIY